MSSLSVAEFVQAAAAAAAAFRLLSAKLGRQQKALLLFISFNAVAQLSLAPLPVRSALYFWSFISYTVLNWAAGFLAVREMFSLSMGGYPGIRTAARWTLYVSISLALLLSLAITYSAWGPGRNGRSRLFYIQVADRSVLVTLIVIIGGLILFLSRYPLHLPRNTYVSFSFFSCILLCQALPDLIDSFGSQLFYFPVDIAGLWICAVLYCGWAYLLGPETSPVRVSVRKVDETGLLRELEAMNAMLVRVGRR
jgi:hypothetical protein